jgi:hypothetical protein
MWATVHFLPFIRGGQTAAAGDKAPGADWGGLGLIGTHTPAERIISRIKIYGEESGRITVRGRAKQAAH